MPDSHRGQSAPTPQRKKRGPAFPWMLALAIVLPVVVPVVGGVIAYRILTAEVPGDREELVNRLIGPWQADVEGTPEVSVTLTADEEGLTLGCKAPNAVGLFPGMYRYKVLRHGSEQLVLRASSPDGRDAEWALDFDGDNEFVWSTTSGKTRRLVFRRAGDQAPAREERERLARQHRETLEGKWSLRPALDARELLIEFGPDDSIRADFSYPGGRTETVKGEYRVLWADEKTARLAVKGLEGRFVRLIIEFRDDDALGVTAKRDGSAFGVVMSASRTF